MKRNLIFVLAIIASAVSCTKEQNTPEQSATSDSFIAQRESTRSNLDGLTPVWVDGDVLGISTASGTDLIACPLIDAETGSFNGTDVPQADTYYAVTPYSTSASFTEEGKLIASIPVEQHLSRGQAIAPEAMIAAGVSSTRTFFLRNCTGLVQIEIRRDGIKQVQFQSSAEGEAVAGKFSIDPAAPDNGIEVIEGSSIITLLPEGESFAQGVYYIGVLPCSLSGISITFTDSEDKTATVTKAAGTTIERNGGLDFGTFFTWNISTPDELEAWAKAQAKWTEWDEVNILNDIDMAGRTWTPVSNFSGVINGNNHSIFNLQIERAGYASFIEVLTGSISNLSFGKEGDNTRYCVTAIDDKWSLALAAPIGEMKGASSLTNVKSYGSVTCSAGLLDGTGGNFLSGIVGKINTTGSVSGCDNYASVNFSAPIKYYADLGGIGGMVNSSTIISDCRNHADISFSGTTATATLNLGGIVGAASKDGITFGQDVLNKGNLHVGKVATKGAVNIGGIIGNNNKGAIVCMAKNEGDILNEAIFSNTGVSNFIIAGICGYSAGASKYVGCENKGNVTDASTHPDKDAQAVKQLIISAGIVGYLNCADGLLESCTNWGAITKNVADNAKSAIYLGGVLGYTTKQLTKVKDCTNEISGVVTNNQPNTNEGFFGGVIGYVYGAALTFPIEGCTNKANIINNAAVSYCYPGGVIGHLKAACSVSNCITSGMVKNTDKGTNNSASLRMGGFVGCTAVASTFTKCTCDGSTVINEATLGGKDNGIGGFLGTSSVAGVKIDGNTVKNVSVTSVSGPAGLVAGYSNQNISILNNKMSGTLNGAEITEDDVNSGAEKIYNILSGKVVTYSGNTLL